MRFGMLSMRFWSVSSAVILTLGCAGNVSYTTTSKSPSISAPSSPTTLLITGASTLTAAGQTLQLHASETTGAALPVDVTNSAVWQAAPAGTLAVSTAGVVTCVAAGTAQITASKDGASTSVPITCSIAISAPSSPTTLLITGASTLTAAGQTLQLHASETTGAALPVDVTNSAVWQAAPAGTLAVSTAGVVTCVAAGTAQITASKDGASTSVPITCSIAISAPSSPTTLLITGALTLTAAGQTLQLHASETTGAALPVDVTNSAVWQAAPAGTLAVSTAGVVTCVAAGTAQIYATKDNVSGIVSLTCSIAASSSSLPAIVVSGSSTIAGLGATSQLNASLNTESNPPTDVTASVTWKAAPTGYVSIDASGLMTCLNIGSASVSATKDNVSASLAVTCSIGNTSLSLSEQSLSLRVGSSPTALTALATTPGDPGVDVTQNATWTTGSPVASVNDSGVVSCVQDGATTVTAALASLSQTIPLACSPSSWNIPTYFREQTEEFAGPFPSWINVKEVFNAIGDGIADDTAAIQAALDTITNAFKNVVLWFPHGQYNVKALHVTNGSFFSLIGADPRTTFLNYIGPEGGTILQLVDSGYFRISRLSLDGKNRADIAEEITSTPNGGYNTFNEISDQHIFNTKNGVALTSAAETTIERVFFDTLPGFGIQTGNFNTLNIFINDCLFVGNGTGVTNTGNHNNAGSFIVSNSFFSHSKVADMSMGNTSYATSRHNTSVGSAAAFIAGPIGANPAQITIQNNTVLDPIGIPYQLGNMGPLMLLDNVIRTQNPDLPVIVGFEDSTVSKSVFTLGNTFTTRAAPYSGVHHFPFQGVVTSYDDDVTSPANIPDVKIPTNVYVPPNLNRPVFEVAANSPGSELQKQIDLAVASGGDFPVVHVPAGYNHLATPLLVPPRSHIHFVGDDAFATVLLWEGSGNGPAIEADGSSVTMQGFRVKNGAGTAVDGIRIPVVDQPGSQIVVDQAMLQYGNATSVNFDGLEHATGELFSTYVLGSSTGVNVAGGPFRGARVGTLGVTNYYSGSAQSTGNSTSFNVSHGGKLLVQDNWHDGGATSPRNFVLSGSGTLTEQAGAVYTSSDKPFEIDNFDGKVSLIGLIFEGGFVTHPGQSKTSLFTLGLDGSTSSYLPQSSGNLVVSNLLDEYYGSRGGVQIPSGPAPDLKWLRSMLAQTRSEYAVQRLPLSPGAWRTRLQRISVDGFASALHFLPSSTPNKLTYTLAVGNNLLSTSSKGVGACSNTSLNTPSNASAWSLVEAGDGDYIITDSTGTNAIGLTSDRSTLALAPLDHQYGQRWIIQDVGDGRKLLQSRAAPGVLGWNFGACPQLVNDRTLDLARWTFTAY